MWWDKKDKKETPFMIHDDRDLLNKIDYLVEELNNDNTLFEMVKNYVESVDTTPHEYTSQSQQLVEEIISSKTGILKLLIGCVEKERALKTTPEQSKIAV